MEAANQKMKLKDYRDNLLKELKNPEFAAAYLEEVLESGDKAAFLIALRDVVEAGGGMTIVAQHAHLQRQSLYKALSKRGNPTLTTLQDILKPLGLRVAITRVEETSLIG
jgi:probable addiction module antidote protein